MGDRPRSALAPQVSGFAGGLASSGRGSGEASTADKAPRALSLCSSTRINWTRGKSERS